LCEGATAQQAFYAEIAYSDFQERLLPEEIAGWTARK
jgi:hypothetical protein